jgi:hypothetical protein
MILAGSLSDAWEVIGKIATEAANGLQSAADEIERLEKRVARLEAVAKVAE